MSETIIRVLKDFFFLAGELLVLFIGISLLINVLQSFVPFRKLEKLIFNKNPFLANLSGAVLGLVTPFCSCSTVPMLVTMLNRGVPFQTAMTFLFTSPLLDPWILSMMAVILGWKVTVIYATVTFVFSMMIGWLLDKWGFQKALRKVRIKGDVLDGNNEERKLNWNGIWKETWGLFRSVYLYLIIGAFIGAFIKGAIPTAFITSIAGGDQWWVIPIAAVIGVPLYIRLSTMLPVSQALMIKGMALGPIMALLIGGAGASLPEITMLNSIFKKRLVFAFVSSVFIMATFSGLLFHFMY